MKQETVFLAVYLLDKTLEKFPDSDMDLVLAAALRIASKYEDVYPVNLEKTKDFLKPYDKE